MTEPMRVLTPGEATRELEVSAQSLRRYALAYDQVFDPIPQHNGQRVYSDAIVERLRQAIALERAKHAGSIKDALAMVRDGVPEGVTLARSGGGAARPEQVEAMVGMMSSMAQQIARLTEQLEEMQERQRALPAPTGDEIAARVEQRLSVRFAEQLEGIAAGASADELAERVAAIVRAELAQSVDPAGGERSEAELAAKNRLIADLRLSNDHLRSMVERKLKQEERPDEPTTWWRKLFG
jgi:DNA-binding transcriptional MerR regulator